MCNKISIYRSRGGISLKKNFSTDHQVTTYLRKTYDAGKMFNLGLGSISARKDLKLKSRLIKQESYQTLASIHSGIEAKYEFMKQLGLILTIFIFSLTTMIGSLTLYVQQSMKNYDWTHEAMMLDVKAHADLLESREWLKDPVDLYKAKRKLYAENLSEQKISYNNELTKYFNNYYYTLVSFIIIVLLIVSPIVLRYRWISSIHFCVKEAYKQKEKIENQAS